MDHNLRSNEPMLLKQVQLSAPKAKSDTDPATYPVFSICVEKKDGQRYRREYAFITNIVRFAGESPCESTTPPVRLAAQAPLPVAAEPQQDESLGQRLKRRFRALTHGRVGG